MDTFAKLQQVSGLMHYEPAEDCTGSAPVSDVPRPDEVWECPHLLADEDPMKRKAVRENMPVYRAVLPGGKRITLLKTLLTSACENDCAYCACRAGRDFQRVNIQPEEMAKAFMELHRKGVTQGLFLSSGVFGGGVRTQDRLIAAAEILRLKMGFRGYLHLKIMPGAEHAQLERAMQLADRVSVNLEAPNPGRLERLAPRKVFFEQLLRPLQWVEQIRKTVSPARGWNGRWPSTVTQFVVGGVGENDLELLTTTEYLYRRLNLKRAYFSGFEPISDTPLESHPPTNPWREHRLYQASFLLRDYGFDLEDMPFEQNGYLPLGVDPKKAWAEANLSQAPVEINRADRHELLRVPGIGIKGVEAILAARQRQRVHSLGELRALGIQVNRVAGYILIDGKRPPIQTSLF